MPGLADVFHVRPLEPEAWLLMAVWPVMVFGAEELRKAVFRRTVWRGDGETHSARAAAAA